MKLTVRLEAFLEQWSPVGTAEFEYEMPVGSRVSDLVAALGIPDELANVVIINDETVVPGHPLNDHASVTIMPPLAGG